ncbi:MAG: FAD:protein FMN transferase, partial [Planctomycetota bacterium]
MLTTISHKAMAAEFAVLLAPSDAALMDAALGALESLDEIEQSLTVYRPDSEISRINAAAGESPVVVSESTFGLIARALHWSRESEGAFDITAGPLIDAWGFTQRRGRKPSESEIRLAMDRMGYQHVHLDDANQSVRLDRPGMQLNLGAIGKGFALDTLADRLTECGLKHFLIHGGGSSILAKGNQSSDARGWAVGLSHPTKPTRRVAGIRLYDQSLSTSGSGKQYFHFRGQRYGHVIDPRTGYPSDHWLSLTAVATNATDAEALSTAYFLQTQEQIASRYSEPEPTMDLPSLVGMLEGERQEAVRTLTYGDFHWVDAPPDL